MDAIIVSHSEFAETSASDVWSFWSNPATWATWDTGIEWCKLEEGSSFSKGGVASLLPKGAPAPVKITFTECITNQCFSDEGETPLGKIILLHELSEADSGVKITHTLRFIPKSVETKKVFESTILLMMKKELPEAVKLLAKLSEEKCLKRKGGVHAS